MTETRLVPETARKVKHAASWEYGERPHPEMADKHRREFEAHRPTAQPAALCETEMHVNGAPTMCECGRFIFKPKDGWASGTGQSWRTV